jgi:two-component sensor histidine kinase
VTSAPITVTLPRDAGAPRRARALLREHADTLDAARLDTAVLLISELVTNAVLHGGGEIRLLIDADSSRRAARFAVSDEGGGSPVVRDDPGADGGWGLRLVGQLAARWGVLEGRTQVWFEV